MKKVLKISTLLLLYILLCGKSCKEDENDLIQFQEKEVLAAKESIRDEFEVDYLSEGSKYAAEVSAIQKLQDLSDYLEIYSDVSLDAVFRAKAGELIRKMYVSENAILTFGIMNDKPGSHPTLGEFMDQGVGMEILHAEMAFDSLTVRDPLQRAGKELYRGTLRAYQRSIIYTLTDTISSKAELINIEFFASRIEKNFGNDTLNIWNVALGDMTDEE